VLVTWILAWLHVFSAICWLGGGMVFVFILSPSLARLSPAARGEFMVKIAPKMVRFLQASAGLTILFGVLLLYNIGGFGLLSPSSSYGIDLTIGVTFGLLAFFETEFVTAPMQLKVVRLLRDMQAEGQHQPPPELPNAVRRASLAAVLAVVLLILTSIFMVGAGFY
jgi:uncharacterized membrane protein